MHQRGNIWIFLAFQKETTELKLHEKIIDLHTNEKKKKCFLVLWTPINLRNQDKLRPNGPFGLSTDFTITPIYHSFFAICQSTRQHKIQKVVFKLII